MIATITRESLRKDHQVRIVTSQEEGVGLHNLPNGTYGWTHAPVSESPLFAKPSFLAFEMHKSADDTAYLIGYLTSADAAAIQAKQTPLEVRVYPESYEDATELVALPANRLRRKTHQPLREPGSPVHVSVLT